MHFQFFYFYSIFVNPFASFCLDCKSLMHPAKCLIKISKIYFQSLDFLRKYLISVGNKCILFIYLKKINNIFYLNSTFDPNESQS